MNDHPWQPGEHTRYNPCDRHATALARIECTTGCVVEFRPTQETR